MGGSADVWKIRQGSNVQKRISEREEAYLTIPVIDDNLSIITMPLMIKWLPSITASP